MTTPLGYLISQKHYFIFIHYNNIQLENSSFTRKKEDGIIPSP